MKGYQLEGINFSRREWTPSQRVIGESPVERDQSEIFCGTNAKQEPVERIFCRRFRTYLGNYVLKFNCK